MFEKIERLSELHDKIKENKYRENMHLYLKYASGYYNLLFDFLETFYEMTKEAKKNGEGQLSKLDPMLFYHDFHAAILTSKMYAQDILEDAYDEYGGSPEKDWDVIEEEMIEIENGIGCIHRFIESGRFDIFYAWKRGVYMRFEWNNKEQCYEPKHIVKEYKEGNRKYILENNIFPTLDDVL